MINTTKVLWIADAFKLIVALLVSKIMMIKKSNRDIWLISERRGEARDNGYHLFKYIRENYPSQKVYYVIDSSASDFHKVKEFGAYLHYDSLKHYVYYMMASKLVCTHLGSNVPDSPVCWKAEEWGIVRKKRAYIKHGIVKETLPQHMYKNTKADLYICGAKPEYLFVSKKFGYPRRAVKYLGLCRFDALHNYTTKNQILVMPTWRQWFGLTPRNGRTKEQYDLFVQSDYFKHFHSFLNNKTLDRMLNEHNLQLIFYPHHEIQCFLEAFQTPSTNIIIADEKEYDVQQLLKESSLLITDYSSIAFDFAYMRKSVIYYQFDVDTYFEKHYQKGYFHYERDGFGPVFKHESELVQEIGHLVANGLHNQEKYVARVKSFFPLFDQNNCERNYKTIMEI